MGPNTSNFIPLPETRIYLNTEHLRMGKTMLEDDTITCVRLCRSFSSIISDISYRPYTIWTLCEYDSSQSLDSQSQKLSRMFQSIASEVIKNGAAARIEVILFHELHNTLKKGNAKDTVGEIIGLQENGSIPVINNLNLSRLLHNLADSMTTSIKNANHTAAKLLAQHLYN
ncbi:hypothetical protein BY458DRAFT_526939 [Sporodiniella umbellata]|nr:hypothetical protein BY458DRAFT_526939 [Sporodiniella umbellata]